MPNWCSTTYRFCGDKKELEIFYKKVNEWRHSFTKTDFGADWLGNILYGAGLENCIDNPDPEARISCRGTITDMSLDDSGIDIWVESAWVPMAKMWVEVLKVLKLNSIRFCFEAEEPGCELYWIYDPDLIGAFDGDDYYIDTCIGNNYYSEYCDEKTVIERVNQLIPTNCVTIEEAKCICNNFNEEHNGDEFIYLNEFERVNEIYD